MNTTAERQVPLLELESQHREIRDEVLPEVLRVIDSQKFILGQEVTRFESEIAAYCRAAHAVGCASGSDALLLALLALEIGPGDEVITTPYTFFATAGAIALAGATPVFVDVNEKTYNIDPQQLREADQTTADYLAIGPVFATSSKERPDPVVGLEGVRRARELTRKPMVAIGGITRANARSVLEAGADTVAVISDLLRGPRKSAEEFFRILG